MIILINRSIQTFLSLNKDYYYNLKHAQVLCLYSDCRGETPNIIKKKTNVHELNYKSKNKQKD